MPDGAGICGHPRAVSWVYDEAGIACQKAWVFEVIVSSSPPLVPTCHSVPPVTLIASGEGSDPHSP